MGLVLRFVAIVSHGQRDATAVVTRTNRHASKFVRHNMFRKREKDEGKEDDQE